MNIRTINLTGSEVAVKVGGGNSEIKNNGIETIYASAASGIVAGADGVVSIPAGASVTVTDTCGTVYILGTGSVEVVGKDFVAPVFKTAAAGGGVIASNPNLLINPDFAINQRVQSAYSSSGYTVDGWKLSKHSSVNTIGTVSVTSDGIIITSGGTRLDTYFRQHIENGEKLAGKKVTASFEIAELTGSIIFMQYGSSKTNIISGNGVYKITFDWEENSSGIYAVQFYNNTADCSFSLKWAKLEVGTMSTPYCPPDPATELAKCQRYYQLRSTGDIAAVDMRPSMNTITDIKQRSDSLYEYIAEI